MARTASDLVESWRPGEIVAVDKRMEDLALTIIGRTAMALHKNAGEYREATRAWLRAQFGTRDQQ